VKAWINPRIYAKVSEFKSASNKQKSSKIMKMKMFATLDNTRPHTGNTGAASYLPCIRKEVSLPHSV
jgi:hypothetical protein